MGGRPPTSDGNASAVEAVTWSRLGSRLADRFHHASSIHQVACRSGMPALNTGASILQ